jgi:hypothetical protein
MKRERVIAIRVSEEEYSALVIRKNQPQLAVWAREVLLGQRKRRQVPKLDPAFIRHLSAIGNNFNQLVRSANRRNPPSAARICEGLAVLSKNLEELTEAVEQHASKD